MKAYQIEKILADLDSQFPGYYPSDYWNNGFLTDTITAIEGSQYFNLTTNKLFTYSTGSWSSELLPISSPEAPLYGGTRWFNKEESKLYLYTVTEDVGTGPIETDPDSLVFNGDKYFNEVDEKLYTYSKLTGYNSGETISITELTLDDVIENSRWYNLATHTLYTCDTPFVPAQFSSEAISTTEPSNPILGEKYFDTGTLYTCSNTGMAEYSSEVISTTQPIFAVSGGNTQYFNETEDKLYTALTSNSDPVLTTEDFSSKLVAYANPVIGNQWLDTTTPGGETGTLYTCTTDGTWTGASSAIISISPIPPLDIEAGDKYYWSSTNLVYTCTSAFVYATWDEGVVLPVSKPATAALNDQYFNEDSNTLYTCTSATTTPTYSEEDFSGRLIKPVNPAVNDQWFDVDNALLYTCVVEAELGTWDSGEDFSTRLSAKIPPVVNDMFFDPLDPGNGKGTLYLVTVNNNWDDALKSTINLTEPETPIDGEVYFNTSDNMLYSYSGYWDLGTLTETITQEENSMYFDETNNVLYTYKNGQWTYESNFPLAKFNGAEDGDQYFDKTTDLLYTYIDAGWLNLNEINSIILKANESIYPDEKIQINFDTSDEILYIRSGEWINNVFIPKKIDAAIAFDNILGFILVRDQFRKSPYQIGKSV